MKRGRIEDKRKEKAESSGTIKNHKKSRVGNPTIPVISGRKNQESVGLFGIDDLVLVNQEDGMHRAISSSFATGLGAVASSIQIEAIHKNAQSSFVSQAKYQTFLLVAQAMVKSRNRNANKRYALYGASKEEIVDVICNGFVESKHRQGLELSAPLYALDCLQTAIEDEDGLRHVLIFKAVFGRLEVVSPEQIQPSSEDYDSGIDSLASPRKYIVWRGRLNTHVFPEYVMSFRFASQKSKHENPKVSKEGSLQWIPFDAVVTRLSETLPRSAIDVITKYHSDYQEKKITPQELYRRMTRVIKTSNAQQRNLAQKRLTE